jgi:branched-chain amino acid transport system permease protein
MIKRTPLRGSEKTTAAIYAGVIVILALLPVIGLSPFYIHVLIGVFMYIILASSLRLINLSGQGSLGHAGFMGAGAYSSAVLAKNLGWSPWLTILLGALLTLAIAFLVAIPFSRLRGIYFTMISLFFGMAVLAINQVFEAITGGQSGLTEIPPFFEISKIPYYYFFLILTIVCLLIMYRLEFSRIGLTWKAVAQSYTVASSIGINETGQRILCLAVGGCLGGLAGATYGHYYMVLSLDAVGFLTGLYIFIYMMVGGVNSFSGPIIGTAVLIIIPAIYRDLKEYVPFIFAGIMLLVLYVMPQGLAGLPEQVRNWIINHRKGQTAATEGETINRAP